MILDLDKIENVKLRKAAEIILGYVYEADLQGDQLTIDNTDELSNDRCISQVITNVALLSEQLHHKDMKCPSQHWVPFKVQEEGQDIDTTIRDIITDMLLIKVKNTKLEK